MITAIAFFVLPLAAVAQPTVTYYEDELPTTFNPLYAATMVDERSQELVFDRIFYRSPVS